MLSRMQFAANITFHILFPAITIALAWFLVFFKALHDRGGGTAWMDCYRFWVKIFALCFALGVVSGVTMSFQFGTNWPGYMNTVGNVAGPLLAYEVLTAFFLEATFLGIMLFGANRVTNRVHTLSTILVAIGTTLSAFWILALNSWMQTPAGFTMVEGKAHVASWTAVLFNPSMPYRLTHMLLASGLTASFLIAGRIGLSTAASGDTANSVTLALRTGLYTAAILIPMQIFVGDRHGLNTLEHQPAKVAAMEAYGRRAAAFRRFFSPCPTRSGAATASQIGIPKLASLILTHDLDGEVRGLNDFRGDHPPVAPVFFAFRIMVATGLLMLAVSWFGAWQMMRQGDLSRWLARVMVAMTFSGWVAVVAGWYTTEIGRQPWLAHGILKTADAVSALPAPAVGGTLAHVSRRSTRC